MRRIVIAILLLIVGAFVAAQLMLPGVIQRRIQATIDARDDVRGRVDGVGLCLVCGSYTVSGPSLEIRSTGGWRPLFSAREVEVSVLPSSPLSPVGAIHLAAPSLAIREEEPEAGGLGLPWAAIGRALSPVPVDRVTVEDGTLELENPRLDPPVRWVVTRVELSSEGLAGSVNGPAQMEASGLVASEGRLHLHLELPADGERFSLDATLRELPAVALNDYLRNAVGLDVGGGVVDADLTLRRADEDAVTGSLDSRVEGIDVVDLSDLSEGHPLQLLWEAFTAGALSASSSGGPLELHFEIAESLEPELDAWSVVGKVIRRSVLTLLRSPVSVVGWLADRVVPLDEG